MKSAKIKTHIITISRKFPKGHRREGQETQFKSKIHGAEKLHTIRDNYNLWKKRIDEVNAGKAILSVREWSDKPYRSQQTILFEFDQNSGIDIQELKQFEGDVAVIKGRVFQEIKYHKSKLAAADGLSLEDFIDWFKNYDMTTPKAIIHFTKNHRY